MYVLASLSTQDATEKSLTRVSNSVEGRAICGQPDPCCCAIILGFPKTAWGKVSGLPHTFAKLQSGSLIRLLACAGGIDPEQGIELLSASPLKRCRDAPTLDGSPFSHTR